MFTIILLLIVLYIAAIIFLSGPDLSMYDQPVGELFQAHPDDEAAAQRLLHEIHAVRAEVKSCRSVKRGLQIMRTFADELSADLETDTEFKTTTANGVPCEWAIAKNNNPARRVLFLHGGAFLFGSPKGHRKFADKLAKLTKGVVLSVDYRMLPENKRGASIEDAQNAYHWLLSNAPDGEHPLESLLVAGDSAGGSLALMISAWSKHNAKQKPNCVVAFSPSTDMTLASPTAKANIKTDKMLGEGYSLLTKLPSAVRAWLGLFIMRINPANPLASPLFQDLSDLPPTLIHASSNEVLLGESIRYVNKASASGSQVTLQVWKNQLHDWHLFNMGHGSANAAWHEVETFINRTLPS